MFAKPLEQEEDGNRNKEREREREARIKEYGKGGRKEAVKGREKNYETREKSAGRWFGAGKQAAN